MTRDEIMTFDMAFTGYHCIAETAFNSGVV